MPPSLPAFLEALSPSVRAALPPSEQLEATLEDLVARATAAWPGLTYGTDAFLRALGRRMRSAADVAPTLAQLHAEDLYLACACASGDPTALTAFDRELLAQVDGYLRSLGPAAVDEVKQALRSDLLVSRDGAPPKISTYSGAGPLAKWLRVSAVRQSLALQRSPAPVVDREDAAALNVADGAEDLDLQHLKARYRADFQSAFRETLAALPDRDANLLRFHYLDGLNVDQLGALYHVHRATAARWVGNARDALLDGTRKLLMARLQLARSEVDSLLKVVRSNLDLSLRRALKRS